MKESRSQANVVWKETPWVWLAVTCMGILLSVVFGDGLTKMVLNWEGKAEYSYGWLVPFITLFLIWQKKETLRRIPFRGSWTGIWLILLGIAMFIIGTLSVLYSLIQYAFLIVLAGCVLAFVGHKAFRVMAVPLLVLIFMIPLPDILNFRLSETFQLWSSEIGVWILRQLGVSVFLQGNVIDLGSYKLQVQEACNGLRYLYPLMTFGFITAYFFKAPLWKRAVVVLSTIPITILMNSARIAVIGVMVDHWGKSMAEGFLHEFEGWLVFVICLAILLGEMWLLVRLSRNPRPLHEVFGFAFPSPAPAGVRIAYRSIPTPFVVGGVLLVLVAGTSALLPPRIEVPQPRETFSAFPMQLGDWDGTRQKMKKLYIDALKFDDYLMADYTDPDQQYVNLYAAYYASQRAKGVPHSPRACIPGDGWSILSLNQIHVPGARVAGGWALSVNRVEIEKNGVKELVYYWFQERGRDLTSEYLVKWYLFWDALTKNRSDGALVRLVTQLKPGQSFRDADEVLTNFVQKMSPQLGNYIPE